MAAAFLLAAKDLRQRLRDRTFFIIALAAPFGLAAIFSVLLPSSDGSLDLRYVVVDLDRGEISAGFLSGPMAGIEEAGIAEVVQAASEAAGREVVESGEADAAAVIPAGFGDAIAAGEQATIQVIGSAEEGLATDILRSVAGAYAADLQGVRLSVATVLATGGDLADAAAIAARAIAAHDETPPVQLVDRTAEVRQLPANTFYAAAMAIFFLFFTAQFGVLSLLGERRQGTLSRLVAAPIPPWSIVLGKALVSFVLGLVAMAVLVVASTLLLGADWGEPLGVALLVVAAVTSALGITALITTLGRTEEQAGGWNAVVAVTMAILGGAFFDLSSGPEILIRLSFLTPHAWFLDGLDQMVVPSFSLDRLALPLLALFGIGLVTGAVGLFRARSLVAQR